MTLATMKNAQRIWTVLVPVLFLGISMFTALIISARLGVGMVEQVVPLQDASMMVKNELNLFQLSLEQSIYVAKTGYYENVWEHLDKAEWYAHRMLEGGEGGGVVYVPLKDPELRKEIMVVLAKLETLRSLARERIEMGVGRAAESKLQNEFNLLSMQAWQQADTVEAALHKSIAAQLLDYEVITIGLLVACVLFTVIVTISLYLFASRRAEAIAALSKSEEELRKFKFILDGAGEEFYFIDPSGRLEYVNEAAAGSLGYTIEEMLNMNVSDFVPYYAETGYLKRFEELKNREILTFESIHLSKDGRPVPKEVKAVYMRLGEKEYTCSFARDISERKVLERQRADFYAMVTHDLKSPLAAILGYSELLQTDEFDKKEKERLDIISGIHRSGKKLLNIVEDFLTFSRLESGSVSLSRSHVEIARLMEEAGAEFFILAREKGLTLEVSSPEGLPRCFLDKRLVERALQNIIQNAVSYTPAGGLVSVKAGTAEEAGRELIVISVTDNGPGIPVEDQGRIFDKYYRSSKTAGMKGTGLGLAIVKAVAEAHGGRVDMESAEGAGSTFRLVLPVK